MNPNGKTISFPLRVDQRGTTATVSGREDIIAQAIADVVETRQGERVMMPDYGIPDFVFAVQDFSFAPRLAFHIEEQVLKYVSLVKSLKVKAETDEDGRAIVAVQYTTVGEINAPKNLVFPVWKYLGGEA
jgi:phage baseplate assembly protein W